LYSFSDVESQPLNLGFYARQEHMVVNPRGGMDLGT